MIETIKVESEYQGGPTEIRVLRPKSGAKQTRTVYVLPVEAGLESRFGSGLEEVERLGLVDKYGIMAVAPTFSHRPCFADHPSDPGIRQVSYFFQDVLPLVEEKYPGSASQGRRLLGFSKSGFASVILLCVRPDLFDRAAVFDTPFSMDRFDTFGWSSAEIYGTQENFERYRVSRLLEENAAAFRKGIRLGLFGGEAFQKDHQEARKLLQNLSIPHAFDENWERKHVWESGWIPEAMKFLAGP